MAVVLELYSRRVIGWAIAKRMTATLVCDALIMALWRWKIPTGVIAHSDRGSQCCSTAYQKLFRKHHLDCSMNKKGDWYDKAAMESLNHSFKVEASMENAFRPVPMQNMKCSSISNYITIANDFIQNWATLARKLLKLKKSLCRVSVISG